MSREIFMSPHFTSPGIAEAQPAGSSSVRVTEITAGHRLSGQESCLPIHQGYGVRGHISEPIDSIHSK